MNEPQCPTNTEKSARLTFIVRTRLVHRVDFRVEPVTYWLTLQLMSDKWPSHRWECRRGPRPAPTTVAAAPFPHAHYAPPPRRALLPALWSAASPSGHDYSLYSCWSLDRRSAFSLFINIWPCADLCAWRGPPVRINAHISRSTCLSKPVRLSLPRQHLCLSLSQAASAGLRLPQSASASQAPHQLSPQQPRVRISQPSQTSAANTPKEHTDTSEITILLRFNIMIYSNNKSALILDLNWMLIDRTNLPNSTFKQSSE